MPIRRRTDPLSGFNSPSEFHQCHTADVRHRYRRSSLRWIVRRESNEWTVIHDVPHPRPSEVLSPSASSRQQGAALDARASSVGEAPPSTNSLASSGFRNPSTPCSPRSLLGLFHPSPALGVSPSRLFSLPRAVRPLERRDLRRVAFSTPLSRYGTLAQVPPELRGLAG